MQCRAVVRPQGVFVFSFHLFRETNMKRSCQEPNLKGLWWVYLIIFLCCVHPVVRAAKPTRDPATTAKTSVAPAKSAPAAKAPTTAKTTKPADLQPWPQETS